MKKVYLFVVPFCTLFFVNSVFAKSEYVPTIPLNNLHECGVCHVNKEPDQGSDRNAFGKSYEDGAYAWDGTVEGEGKKLWEVDTDGDGFTNGEEMGDPNGTWSEGDAVNATQTDPADANDKPSGSPCGNGTLDDGEECDGSELNGKSCTDAGASGTGLACNDQCKFDTTNCNKTMCGDNKKEGAEVCDGTDLDGKTCTDAGAQGTGLACKTDCTFDTSACVASTTCGNATIDNGEACDGTDLDNKSCGDFGMTGTELACASDCSFDKSACIDSKNNNNNNQFTTPTGTLPVNRESREIFAYGECRFLIVASPAPAYFTFFALLGFIFLRRKRV